MKTPSRIPAPVRFAGNRGFTLVEMMFTVGIFSLVVLGLVSLQLVAMRVYTLGATMLSATTSGRQTMNHIRDNIRGAKIVMIGTYQGTNGSLFTPQPLGSLQQGNALEIQFTNAADTNYLIYYQDPATTNMYSFSNSVTTAYTNSGVVCIAHFITNNICFAAENYQGTVQTNYLNNPIIHVTMQFYQWQFPIGIIGGTAANSYNYYSLNTRIDRRDLD